MRSKPQTLIKRNKISKIEKIFFENFTKRQDSNNDFLLRLLLIVGAVIAGYAYLLLNIDVVKVDRKTMLFMVIFTEILLMIYFKIIYDEGFAFRRDQLVVFRILKKYRLISESEEDDRNPDKVFTYYFNPLKKFEYSNNKCKTKNVMQVFLLPAFHNTLAASIFLIQIAVYASFYIKFIDSNFEHLLYCLCGLNCVISLIIVIRKYIWLKKLYKKAYITNS